MRRPAAKRPGEEEFERFVKSSTDSLLRTAYLLVGDLSEGEDLAQETLVRVARRWSRVRRMEQPIAYARRILINLALDGRQRRLHRNQELETAAAVPCEDLADIRSARDLDRAEVRTHLLSAIDALPPRQRAVLVLRFLEDLSEAHVAQALDCSLGTVKSTTSRALARLQAVLEPVPASQEAKTKE